MSSLIKDTQQHRLQSWKPDTCSQNQYNGHFSWEILTCHSKKSTVINNNKLITTEFQFAASVLKSWYRACCLTATVIAQSHLQNCLKHIQIHWDTLIYCNLESMLDINISMSIWMLMIHWASIHLCLPQTTWLVSHKFLAMSLIDLTVYQWHVSISLPMFTFEECPVFLLAIVTEHGLEFVVEGEKNQNCYSFVVGCCPLWYTTEVKMINCCFLNPLIMIRYTIITFNGQI